MIDAHAHLLSKSLFADQIIANMEQDGLDYIINIGTNLEDSKAGIQLAQNNSNIFTTVGIHPEYAHEIQDEVLNQIDNLATNSKVVAIGEIGLDYHYGATEVQKERQKSVFIKQLEIANKHCLPVVIHCRDAVQDVLQILKSNKHLLNSGFCMHCYSEGANWVQEFINLGAFFSFTGNITFKKVDRSFLPLLPKNKIMVETDCPYLSPEPLRGQINTPKNVAITAQKIADTLEMSIQDFDKLSTQNTKTFFKIK